MLCSFHCSNLSACIHPPAQSQRSHAAKSKAHAAAAAADEAAAAAKELAGAGKAAASQATQAAGEYAGATQTKVLNTPIYVGIPPPPPAACLTPPHEPRHPDIFVCTAQASGVAHSMSDSVAEAVSYLKDHLLLLHVEHAGGGYSPAPLGWRWWAALVPSRSGQLASRRAKLGSAVAAQLLPTPPTSPLLRHCMQAEDTPAERETQALLDEAMELATGTPAPYHPPPPSEEVRTQHAGPSACWSLYTHVQQGLILPHIRKLSLHSGDSSADWQGASGACTAGRWCGATYQRRRRRQQGC